jgi:hypothetical protein
MAVREDDIQLLLCTMLSNILRFLCSCPSNGGLSQGKLIVPIAALGPNWTLCLCRWRGWLLLLSPLGHF